MHRLEEDLVEASKTEAKQIRKLQDKQEDIASLEKILKLKSLRLDYHLFKHLKIC